VTPTAAGSPALAAAFAWDLSPHGIQGMNSGLREWVRTKPSRQDSPMGLLGYVDIETPAESLENALFVFEFRC
jgi:hypothetical protein